MSRKLDILFIAWDSPDVKYLEGLFVPIFRELNRQWGHQVHILHFSWGSEARQSFLSQFCEDREIRYTPLTVSLKPIPSIGKFLTVMKGTSVVRDYVLQNSVDLVMPRSTMPAKMVLPLLRQPRNFNVIFDADGLPIEERVDFAGLKPGSYRHKSLKRIEKKIIKGADGVITRTEKAATFLSSQYDVPLKKFSIVRNGSDSESFRFSADLRHQRRKELGVPDDAFLLVYSGSLGPQYGVEQMIFIHKMLRGQNIDSRLLILTNHPKFLAGQSINSDDQVMVRSVDFRDIPGYLSSGDLGFAIRKDAVSMQGVAPIKIGEYLLNGLPIIASAPIGDSKILLAGQPFIHLLEDYSKERLEEAVRWIERSILKAVFSRQQPAEFARNLFSIEVSAKTYEDAILTVL